MTYSITGTYLDFPVTLRWSQSQSRLVGDDFVWSEIVYRSRRPLMLTPTGPVLERPDPTLPGHALALASEVMRIDRVRGDAPRHPEGFNSADFDVPDGAAA